jgi:hypothetical protein
LRGAQVSSTSHGTTASSRAPVDPIGRKPRAKWSDRYIREDFFLGGSFRNRDDRNAQLR